MTQYTQKINTLACDLEDAIYADTNVDDILILMKGIAEGYGDTEILYFIEDMNISDDDEVFDLVYTIRNREYI